MPKCPECKAEIHWLYEYEEAEVRHDFYLGYAGEPCRAHRVYTDGDYAITGYECMICGQHLFNREADAVAFLEGKPVEIVAEPEKYHCVIKLYREEVTMMFPEELREERMAEIGDVEMQRIARKLADALLETGYWDILRIIAEDWS